MNGESSPLGLRIGGGIKTAAASAVADQWTEPKPGIGYYVTCTTECTCCVDNAHKRGIFTSREAAERRVAYMSAHPEVLPIIIPGRQHDPRLLGRPAWEFVINPVNYAVLGDGKIAIEEWPGGGTWYRREQLFSVHEGGRLLSDASGDPVADGEELF